MRLFAVSGRRRAAIVAVLAAALFGLLAATAAAHYTEVYHGTDKAWVDSSHDHLDVQDNECDGHNVFAEGYDSSGYHSIVDGNGCNAGYGHLDGINFTQYRICEGLSRQYGCSAWRST